VSIFFCFLAFFLRVDGVAGFAFWFLALLFLRGDAGVCAALRKTGQPQPSSMDATCAELDVCALMAYVRPAS